MNISKQDPEYNDKMAQDEIKPMETFQQQDKQLFESKKDWIWPTEGWFAIFY